MGRYLLVPGLFGSGTDHWQTHWESAFAMDRVRQDDWDTPSFEDWAVGLENAVEACGHDVVLIAHSLGAVLVAKWGASTRRRVAGALLVAPSDTEASSFPECTYGFTPMPLSPLPFPSFVVSSTDDPYIAPSRSSELALAWRSEEIVLGPLGHIGASRKLGLWPEGLKVLSKVAESASWHDDAQRLASAAREIAASVRQEA